MKRIIRRYELTDAEWERLQPYFPERQMGDKGRPRREPREMLNGIFWIARSGAAWRDLPERYGPWQTVYKRFKDDLPDRRMKIAGYACPVLENDVYGEPGSQNPLMP